MEFGKKMGKKYFFGNYWIDSDAITADSAVYLSTYIVLYACGASLRGDATFGRWLSP